MDRVFKYVFASFTIVLFIAATTGVRMYSHHCFTTDVERSSLIKSLATCDEHLNSEGRTGNCESKSCCNSEHDSEALPIDNDCCDDEVRFLKVTDDFIFSSTQSEKNHQHGLLLGIQTLDDLVLNRETTVLKKWLITPIHPPQKSGKTLIVFLQQQKADPNPSA